MIKEVKMYTVICDNCGKDSTDGTEYSAWGDASQAQDDAEENNWLKEGDKHYCPECFFYDEEDKLILRYIEPVKKMSLKGGHKIILMKDLPFCPKGREFKEDCNGNYFHSMSDDEAIEGKLKSYFFTKDEVRNNPEWFMHIWF